MSHRGNESLPLRVDGNGQIGGQANRLQVSSHELATSCRMRLFRKSYAARLRVLGVAILSVALGLPDMPPERPPCKGQQVH